ncbi:MAG: polysaccharide pyruvyl transferase CsaB [Armatimonadetes bacterium]|nr:polysaccharide pyruvyl transferase CsaB [Armatimonadota bacterium]
MKCIVSGYYGFGNVGDEATLVGMLAAFRRLGVKADVTVLSADPDRTISEHPGVNAVHRMKLGPIIRAMRRADIVISGGGSLLQDVTSVLSPYYYLSILRLARLMRCKTMVYAQGVGPLIRDGTRRAVARALNRTDLITVRDSNSKSLLEEIGVTRQIHLSADPSFLVETDVREADRLLEERGFLGADIIGVSLRPWPAAGDWLNQVVQGISRASEKLGAKLICLPMQPAQDDPVCLAVRNAAMISSYKPGVVKGLVARCRLVVGMRLHSLIFAAGAVTPFVPIVYDPKVASFAQACSVVPRVRVGERFPFQLNVEGLDSSAVSDAIVAAWELRSEFAGHLASRLHDWEDLALKSGRLAIELARS